MTRFHAGDTVVALDTVQGMTKGARYVVDSLDQQHTPFGTFVTYLLRGESEPSPASAEGRGTTLIPVANGHLLLEEAE